MFISLNGKPLKVVNQFIYFSSNISSSLSDVNMYIGKSWTAIDKITTITIVELYHLTFNETPVEKTRWELHKDTASCFEQIL